MPVFYEINRRNILSFPVATNSETKLLATNAGYFPILTVHEQSARIFYRTGAGHLGDGGRIAMMESDLFTGTTKIIHEFSAPHDLRNPSVLITENIGYLAALEYGVYSGSKGLANPHASTSTLRLRFFRAEDDNLQDWHELTNVSVSNIRKRLSPFHKILQLADRWVMPAYGEGYSSILVSRDRGLSWHKLHDIAYGYAEPALTVTRKGRFIAILRGLKKFVRNEGLSISFSDDAGRTWSAPKLLVHGFAHPADILTTKDGIIVLTFGIRLPVHQAIATLTSDDEGTSWREPQPVLIHKEIFRNCDFGYPSTIEIGDNRFATVFYSQPLLSMRFDFHDAARYDSRGTELHFVVWEH